MYIFLTSHGQSGIFVGRVYPINLHTIMNAQLAKLIIVTGALLVATGTALYFFHDKLHWIGRLLGDVSIEKERVRFYFPITTMILFSILLSIVLRIANKLFH